MARTRLRQDEIDIMLMLFFLWLSMSTLKFVFNHRKRSINIISVLFYLNRLSKVECFYFLFKQICRVTIHIFYNEVKSWFISTCLNICHRWEVCIPLIHYIKFSIDIWYDFLHKHFTWIFTRTLGFPKCCYYDGRVIFLGYANCNKLWG